ncbi:MAG TPA: AAA family ATPase [Acidimicrobiia bacterium]|jgi:chromosome partitioning protein|nr:AAA family ATPase [Acidimicrobiia bacterium]
MGTTVAFANQKGGVAKTTTVHSLAEALVERDHDVLMVDLDPQACLTYAAGVDPEALDVTLHDVLLGRTKATEAIVETSTADLLPSSIDVAGAEVHLLTKTGREFVLSRALKPVKGGYDVVLIDCGPSLGILTINGLTAADAVVIPFQCETLSHRGVGQLLETVDDVRNYTNEDLRVMGGVATMFDGRTRLANDVLESVAEVHGITVLDPPIPKSVRVAEAPGRGRSVLRHAPRSKPAVAYRALAETFEGLL